MKRPTPVLVFGILEIVTASIGLFGILVFFGIFIFSQLSGESIQTLSGYQAPSWYIYSTALLSFILNIIGIIAGIALLMLKRWALYTVIFLAIVNGTLTILYWNAEFVLFKNSIDVTNSVITILSLGYIGILLWFMTRPHIQKAFKS